MFSSIEGRSTAKQVPQQRFVAILREPVRRDLSWFNHRADAGFTEFLCSGVASAWMKAGGAGAASEQAALEAYGDAVGCSLDALTSCLTAAAVAARRAERLRARGDVARRRVRWPTLREARALVVHDVPNLVAHGTR